MSSDATGVPTVWHFIPCDRVDRLGAGPYSLTRVRLTIPNPFGQPPPRVYPELWLYLVLSNGTGTHTFQVQQTCLRDQTRVANVSEFDLDFGHDPTAVHEVTVRLSPVLFWADGQCEFYVYTAGRRLRHLVIDVR